MTDADRAADNADNADHAAAEPAGSGLAAEKARRLGRVGELRQQGVEPYPYRFDRTHTLTEVRAEWGGLPEGTETDHAVAVAGRVMLKRDSGKLVFATIRDRGGEVQLFVSQAVVGEAAFADIKALDLGDWVGVHGTVMTTRKGELSVKVERLELLAKAVRPLPDKWHGLTDVDTRFRQRYADLIVNDEARRVFEVRHALLRSFRDTLHGEGFVEVETPVLHVEAGGAHARPFHTHHNALDMPLFLRIALELHLKRLIVGGMERVFEIGRVFRNEGVSTRHNPEFTLLEFYQAYATYEDLMALTEELFVGAADAVAGARTVPYLGHDIDLTPPWRRVSIPEYVASRCQLPLDAVRRLDLATLQPAADQVGGPLRKDYRTQYGDGAAGYLLLDLFEHLAEPELIQPTFVHEYPVAVSPLARRSARHPEFVDRFELFVAGQEMANAFSELNDPDDQRRRLEGQLSQKAAGDDEAHAMDEDFLRALEHGMPPAAGEGIGVDRLAMLLTNAGSIRDVILFPHMRPERR